MSTAGGMAEPESFRVLYLFFGHKRKGCLGEEIKKHAKEQNVHVFVNEVDVLNNARKRNLLKPAVQAKFKEHVASGKYDVVIASPPGSTFSRARWANGSGP